MLDFDKIAKFDGLIFDLDGTLIDSMKIHAKCWHLVGEAFGYPLTPNQMFKLAGAELKTVASNIMQEANMPLARLDEVMAMKRKLTFEKLLNEVELLPAIEVVKHFYGKKPMAIGTGSHKKIVDALLEKLDIGKYFETVVTADEVTKHKPDSQTFLLAAQNIKITPNKCLVFEDSPLGITAASDALMSSYNVETKEFHNYLK